MSRALTFVALAVARCAALTVSAAALSLGSPLGSGTFGCVRWGELDGELVVVKTAKVAEQRAATYLDTEAYINAHLQGAAPDHLAPYLGSCTVDDEKVLVWRAAGERTLMSAEYDDLALLAELAVVPEAVVHPHAQDLDGRLRAWLG